MPVRTSVRKPPRWSFAAIARSAFGLFRPATVSSKARGCSRMSRRYAPSMAENSVSTACDLRSKVVMPNSGGANQVGVLAQRSQRQLCSLPRNEFAAFANDFADTFEEKAGAFHNAATQNNRIGREQRDQIRQALAKIVGFPLDRLAG